MRRQSIAQRKALKAGFVDPLTAVDRSLYAKARHDVAPKYQMPRLLIILLLLAIWLTVSHFTAFRPHMTTWLLTGEFPTTHWTSIAFYVVAFLFSFAAFVWANGQIDNHQEYHVDRRHADLRALYEREHEVTLPPSTIRK